MNKLSHVLSYLSSENIKLFPCDPDTKAPKTRRGFKDADYDYTKFNWSGAVIGIPTGKINNLFVIDLDRHGKADGVEEFKKLTPNGELPDTLILPTRNNGLHLYFRLPEKLQNLRCGKPAPGVDIKANGGYVILWRPERFDADRIKEPPQWLVDLLTDTAPEGRGKGKEEGEGKRTDELFNNDIRTEDIIRLLTDAGWVVVSEDDERYRLRRPGKDRGWSATLHKKLKRFYCFTSNGEPFEQDRTYDYFGVLARLKFDGDFKRAATWLLNEKASKRARQELLKIEQRAADTAPEWRIKDRWLTEFQLEGIEAFTGPGTLGNEIYARQVVFGSIGHQLGLCGVLLYGIGPELMTFKIGGTASGKSLLDNMLIQTVQKSEYEGMLRANDQPDDEFDPLRNEDWYKWHIVTAVASEPALYKAIENQPVWLMIDEGRKYLEADISKHANGIKEGILEMATKERKRLIKVYADQVLKVPDRTFMTISINGNFEMFNSFNMRDIRTGLLRRFLFFVSEDRHQKGVAIRSLNENQAAVDWMTELQRIKNVKIQLTEDAKRALTDVQQRIADTTTTGLDDMATGFSQDRFKWMIKFLASRCGCRQKDAQGFVTLEKTITEKDVECAWKLADTYYEFALKLFETIVVPEGFDEKQDYFMRVLRKTATCKKGYVTKSTLVNRGKKMKKWTPVIYGMVVRSLWSSGRIRILNLDEINMRSANLIDLDRAKISLDITADTL